MKHEHDFKVTHINEKTGQVTTWCEDCGTLHIHGKEKRAPVALLVGLLTVTCVSLWALFSVGVMIGRALT